MSSIADTFQEQIKRMNTIVEYQLQRAATAGSSGIGSYVEVEGCDHPPHRFTAKGLS